MLQASGGVSESEEEIIISMSGTSGTQTLSTSTWTNVATNQMSDFLQGISDLKYGVTSAGNNVLIATGQDVSNYGPATWYSNNDGANWSKSNGVSGINGQSGLMTRTDSNSTGPRFIAWNGYTNASTMSTSNDGATWTSAAAGASGYTISMVANGTYIEESGTYILTGRKKNCYTSNTAAANSWVGQTDLANGYTNTYVTHVLGPVINSGANRRIMAHGYRTVRYNDADGVGGGTAVTYSGNTWNEGGCWGYGKTSANVTEMMAVKHDATSNEFIKGSGVNMASFTPTTKPTDNASGNIDQLVYNAPKNAWHLRAGTNIWESTDYGDNWYNTNTPSDWTSSSLQDVSTTNPSNGKMAIMNMQHTPGTTRVFTTPGPSTSGTQGSVTISGDASAHPGVAQTVTFANGTSATDATTQVKALFSGGTIQNYTVTDISGTSFKVTSTATGDETNLSFSTSAGTSGSLGSTLTVTDGAG